MITTLVAALSLSSLTVPPPSVDDVLQIEEAIATWDTAKAARIIDGMLVTEPDSADLHTLKARVQFMSGEYRQTMTSLAEV